MTRRKLLLIAIGIVVILEGYTVYLIPKWVEEERDLQGLAEQTLTDINVLANCLTAELESNQESPLSNEELVPVLLARCRSKHWEGRSIVFEENGVVVDHWKRPLNIKILDRGAQSGRPFLKVWSVGKNGIDEHGGGDDLVSGASHRIPDDYN